MEHEESEKSERTYGGPRPRITALSSPRALISVAEMSWVFLVPV